jgi:hypothetical protein
MTSSSTETQRQAEERERNWQRKLAWLLRWSERFPLASAINTPPAMNWRYQQIHRQARMDASRAAWAADESIDLANLYPR